VSTVRQAKQARGSESQDTPETLLVEPWKMQRMRRAFQESFQVVRATVNDFDQSEFKSFFNDDQACHGV
jgi:hypothetical protein